MRGTSAIIGLSVMLALSATISIGAAPQGTASAKPLRADFVGAARDLTPPAARGSASAQGMLGFLYEESGQGVPQAYDIAAC